MSFQPRCTLNNGSTIPAIGLGTWKSERQLVGKAVCDALRIGYRHIDCASIYGNETEIGEAIEYSCNEFKISRDDLWLTSKLWNDCHQPEFVRPALLQTLQDLRIETLDLYLIHWPENGSQLKIWRALERIKKEGRTRSIGVSNFAPKHLKELLFVDSEHPVVNQVELSPFLQQKHIYSFCQKENIHLTGYCPLSRGNRFNDSNLSRIAKETKKSAAQVMIRWALQRGHTVIPKSVSPSRIEENANVFDFNLNNEQMKILDGLEEGLRFCPDPEEI